MAISKQLEKAIRDNFPGANNAGVRDEIRSTILEGVSPIHLKGRIGFTAGGLAGLQAVQNVYSEETKAE